MSLAIVGQDISLLTQFSGHIDFTMIGNTLNPVENHGVATCSILTTSTANLNLNNSETVEAAYLYWAGSGTGDFEINLNNETIIADRIFSATRSGRPFFSAFTDVTTKIQNEGNGNYTVTGLDLTSIISNYCSNGTNFGGWAIVIIYSNNTLPINQINVYDGMQSVPNNISIQLDNLNVIDNVGAKIGFLAWEGDRAIAVNESLRINGDLIGNTLNPSNNAFNGTNSFTGATNLYNMDLDFYNIENNIQIGDTSAIIELTSGQDFVMVNCIVTKLNSQLPDASIAIDNATLLDCNDRDYELNFTVFNTTNANGVLRSNAPIAVYANSTLIANFVTQTEIAIGGFENFTEIITIPNTIPNTFQLMLVVDDDGTGNSTIIEFDETNNIADLQIQIPELPEIGTPNNLITCNAGFQQALFNLNNTENEITTNLTLEISFYETNNDAVQNINEIINTSSYTNTSNPQSIFVKVTNPTDGCYAITTFQIATENCPPIIPDAFSPNNDGINDLFIIGGLDTIFVNYQLRIYNRYGNIVYKGSNTTANWDGTYHHKKLPTGTYYYVLELHDNYYDSVKGWLYLMQ